MANKDIANLEAQFPEMSQSVIADVFKTYGKDTKKATEALRAIENQTSLENEKKIRELSELFPTVPKNEIEIILEACNGDLDAAVVPLFNKAEDIRNETTRKEQQESKKRRDNESKKKKDEEIKKKTANLMGIFQTIPIERVQQILDENEGDIEETTNQLLEIVAQQEVEEQKRRAADAEEKRMLEDQERRLQDLKIQALREKFDNLTEAEVVHSLATNAWDIKKALVDVLKISNEKKVSDLKNLFPAISDADLEIALQANEYNIVKTVEALTVQKRHDDSANSGFKVTVKKVEQDLLARSVMLGQQIEQQIAASHIVLNKQEREAEQKAVTQQFRDDLEHIIATQARHGGAPGLAPHLLPKQIDAMLGKQKPVDESPVHSIQQTLAPPIAPENELKGSTVKWNVSVAASPSFPDVGNPVTVQWEISSEQMSTGYDWIGIFPVDQPNKQYLTYQWVGKDKKKGTMFFNAPSQYGEYEFRYFSNSSYAHSSISNRIKVGPQLQMVATLRSDVKKIVVNLNRISGNDYSRAWVGLFEKTQTDNKQYITYEYAAKSDEIVFDAPVKPTQYEIRFFTNSYVDVARSNTISIEGWFYSFAANPLAGKDTIGASWENGNVMVNLNVVTVDPTLDHVWVGLYFTTETNNKQWRRYKYVEQRASIIQFKSPKTAGTYEARVFAANKYEPVIKSNTFKIGM